MFGSHAALAGSQFADPRRDPGYWQTWHEFEVAHGNEDTFREMLRVKRSVQTAFSQVSRGGPSGGPLSFHAEPPWCPQVNYMASEMLEGEAPVMSDSEAIAKQQQQQQAANDAVSLRACNETAISCAPASSAVSHRSQMAKSGRPRRVVLRRRRCRPSRGRRRVWLLP